MPLIFPFDHTPIPAISEVGGKAHSLITMTNAGYAVPNGFVCAAEFFDDWSKTIEASDIWAQLQGAVGQNRPLTELTESIKCMIDGLDFSNTQMAAIKQALPALKEGTLYAVRSSSPEEDLEGSSFAGIYETVLGVDKADIKTAIRTVFKSAFDERVFVYKKAKGFAVNKVEIAAIVMEQIASDTAGVGFSVNPINNDYDEAAINANFGLGESVVSGIVTPDYFVVDKVNGAIVSKTLGNKARSVFLDDGADGGTHEHDNANTNEFSITDDQAREITNMIKAVEGLYGVPMDIEWAYHNDQLYMIQARPITTCVPLPKDMQSEPGAAKRTLYYDVSVLEGITTNKPITKMTQSWMLGPLSKAMTGPYIGEMAFSADGDPKTDMFFGKGVRAYMNFSQLFFLMSPKTLGNSLAQADKSVGEALVHIDKDLYLPDHKFPSVEWRSVLPFALRRIFASHETIHAWVKELTNPLHYKEKEYLPCAEITQKKLHELQEFDGAIEEYAEQSGNLINTYFQVFMPSAATYMSHLAAVSKMFNDKPADLQALGDQLTMGIDGDEAVSLGIALYAMSQLLPGEAFDDLDTLVRECKARQLPDAFLTSWDKFIAIHGMRGPNEMEIANHRYGDDLALAFSQMATMRHAPVDPADTLKEHVRDRQTAYEKLLDMLPPKEVKKLRKHHEIIDALSATRDTLKYNLVQVAAKLRQLALRDGAALVACGRLDSADDIFHLTLDELAAANADSSVRLKDKISARKKEFAHATANIQSFPVLIDSRGRIPSAPAPVKTQVDDNPNVLHGAGISRGVARGRVKIMKDPREKTIQKGDILVTYNTDPGWTPLFIGAEGIVLEIGGVLQHGGVVAREYAKPCVAGIRNVMDKLQDGQMVEVDGTKGTVTLLE